MFLHCDWYHTNYDVYYAGTLPIIDIPMGEGN